MAPVPMLPSSTAGPHIAHVRIGTVGALAGAAGPALDTLLSTRDKFRLASIRAPQRAAQFLAARQLARAALQSVCGAEAAHWRLDADARGAPCVPGRPDLHVSISHCGDLVGCAVGYRALGLDMEQVRARRDHAALLETITTAAERHRFPTDNTARHAILAWTLKEAWLKARGGELFDTMLGRHAELRPVGVDMANACNWWVGDTAVSLVFTGTLPALTGDVPDAKSCSFWEVAWVGPEAGFCTEGREAGRSSDPPAEGAS